MYPKMDIAWDDVRLFLAIAESGSVSAAARKLKIGQPTVTRRLAALEYVLSATLFRRSVRGAALTAAGEKLLPPARKMAEWAAELDRARAGDSGPTGIVRVTAAPFVACDFVAPFAGWLQGKHPGIQLEVLSTMQYLDLVRGEADVALRSRPPGQKDLMLVSTFAFENAVFVSKALLGRLPKRPRMDQLPWIAWAPPWDELPPNPQLEAAIPNFKPTFTSDHFMVNVAAAEAGLGAIVLNRTHHRFTRRNNLVPLHLDLGPFRHSTLHLVCARSAYDVPRIRLVAQLLDDELKRAKGPERD